MPMKPASRSRRTFLIQASLPFLALATLPIHCTEKKGKGEKPADPCEDLSALNESEMNIRKGFNYANPSPHQDMNCGNCQLWIPPKPGKECGGCLLFKGPVFPTGHCTYWAPQV